MAGTVTDSAKPLQERYKARIQLQSMQSQRETEALAQRRLKEASSLGSGALPTDDLEGLQAVVDDGEGAVSPQDARPSSPYPSAAPILSHTPTRRFSRTLSYDESSDDAQHDASTSTSQNKVYIRKLEKEVQFLRREIDELRAHESSVKASRDDAELAALRARSDAERHEARSRETAFAVQLKEKQKRIRELESELNMKLDRISDLERQVRNLESQVSDAANLAPRREQHWVPDIRTGPDYAESSASRSRRLYRLSSSSSEGVQERLVDETASKNSIRHSQGSRRDDSNSKTSSKSSKLVMIRSKGSSDRKLAKQQSKFVNVGF